MDKLQLLLFWTQKWFYIKFNIGIFYESGIMQFVVKSNKKKNTV